LALAVLPPLLSLNSPVLPVSDPAEVAVSHPLNYVLCCAASILISDQLLLLVSLPETSLLRVSLQVDNSHLLVSTPVVAPQDLTPRREDNGWEI